MSANVNSSTVQLYRIAALRVKRLSKPSCLNTLWTREKTTITLEIPYCWSFIYIIYVQIMFPFSLAEKKKKDKEGLFLIPSFSPHCMVLIFKKICKSVFYYINCKMLMCTLSSMAIYAECINSCLCSFVLQAYILQQCSFQLIYIISTIILTTNTLLPFC